MAKGTRFTDKFIMNLKPAEKEYWVREGQGFAIRVLPSGEKAWYYIFTFDGRKRFMRLKNGGYPDVSLADAREAFDIAKVKVKNGIDPLAEDRAAKEERRQQLTFDELARQYINEQIEGQVVDKSVYDIKRVLLGAIDKETGKLKQNSIDDFKDWRNRKACTITQEDAATLLKTVAKRSAASARNIVKAARPMFAYALPRGIVTVNSFQMSGTKTFLPKKVKADLKPTTKSRTLEETEIKSLWKAMDGDCIGSKEAKNALRLMLLLGQRPTEILGLNSSEISGNWWTLPKERTKARLDKNRRDHSVFLVPEALALIGTKKGIVFESRNRSSDGSKDHISINSIGNFIRKNKYFGLAPFGAHDMRRTMRTFMSDIDGISVKASEAVINHALEGTKKNYDLHNYRRQIEKALTLWRDKLVEIIGEPLVKELPSNVISIHSGRKAIC